MPGVKIGEKFIAHNERWLAKTGSCLLISGAAIGTFQGLVVMGFGGVALVTALWFFWRSR
tara:strand:+ start:55 stop:234 length:180 start_codon:yes stop_codon:yes gene_type:complete